MEFGIRSRGEDVVVEPVAVGKGDGRPHGNDEERGSERFVRLRHLEGPFRHLVERGSVLEEHHHLVDGRRRPERRPHDDDFADDGAALNRRCLRHRRRKQRERGGDAPERGPRG